MDSAAAIETTATEVTTPKPLPLGQHRKTAAVKKSTTKAPAAKKATKPKTAAKIPAKQVQTPPAKPVDLWEKHADVESEATDVVAESNKVDRIRAAKPEYAALKAWDAAGAKGKRPATPNLDVIHGRGVAPTTTTEKKQTKVAATVRFFHDAKPMPDSQNKLSSVAYYHTKAIKGTTPRVSTDDLRAILTKAGVADPEHTEWTHTLPNGVVLSTTMLATTAARKAS
jgi:hypothetical protein